VSSTGPSLWSRLAASLLDRPPGWCASFIGVIDTEARRANREG
jgi:hypothetical protein